MNSSKKACLVISIIILFIKSAYSLNPTISENNFNTLNKSDVITNASEKEKINFKTDNSFWENHQSNWKKTSEFNSSYFWNQKEATFITSTGNTVSISNKKIDASTDDSYQKSNGKNYPTKYETGTITYKGYRFTNLDIPSNAVITEAKLTLVGYKYGNTTVTIKAENTKNPSTYSDNKNYLSSANTTSKSVDWNIPNLSNGLQLVSPNLKDIVQEIVSGKDGVTHLSLIISSPTKWECWNYDDRSSSYFPKLDITYSIISTEAVDDTVTLDENTNVVINIFENDSNLPTNGSIVISTQPTNGSIAITDPNNTSSNPSDDLVTYTPNNNYSGEDAFKYKICDNQSNCNIAEVTIIVNESINSCDAIASGNLDTDNDGVSDICDLDDDNDGILDTDECHALIKETPFTVSNGDTVNFSLSTTGNGFVLDVTSLDNSFNLTINGTPLTTQEIEFQQSGTPTGRNIRFQDGDMFGTNTPQVYQYGTITATTPMIRIIVDENLNISMFASKVGNGPLFPLELFNDNSFNTFTWNTNTPNNFIVTQVVTGPTYISGRVYGTSTACDTDNDGIDSSLDTDSDNDGCPDAIEGAKNIKYSQLKEGVIDFANQGGVDENGVPVLANSEDQGQATGTSQNEDIIACKDASDSGYTDSDGDNVSDLYDLDDDNDGILDTDEGLTCTDLNTCSGIDTDLDGIQDHLDTDSDADGCPDAVEGAKNILYSQITNNTIDFANHGGIDSDGVPVLANTGDQQGQAIGASIDENTLACNDSGYPDSDNDGVADIFDLDDDNDGILDTDEGLSCTNLTNCTGIDTDNDGVQDHLDTDSDNDECPDAIEGGKNITLSQLASNRIDIGNQGGIDSDGVPVVVNTESQGQVIGSSTDSNTVICTDDPNSGYLDTDKDGVIDFYDLDDDNDGILDINEGACVTNTGTETKPFTSLSEARNVTSEGTYHFNLNGELFSTFVNTDGYLQVAVDFGNGVGNLPQEASLTNTTRGILSPTILSTLTEAKTAKILHSGGGIDVTTTNTGVIDRIIANETIHKGKVDNTINNDWTGVGADLITINATCTPTDNELHRRIIHLCGNASGFHWTPYLSHQRLTWSGEIPNDQSFSLWVQGDAITIACTDFDTDKDGIIDSLDTDSDNDGCPDATEATNGLATTATLTNGSNGGSSANLGTVSNNNGIPLPLSTLNGTETEGQAINESVITAEKTTINTVALEKTINAGEYFNFIIDATSATTSTFTAGTPDYTMPNPATDTSSSIKYKWYKNTDVNTIVSTTNTLTLNEVSLVDAGDYTIIIYNDHNTCNIEETITLIVNSLPLAANDTVSVDEDTSIIIDVLGNDSFGDDGANAKEITLSSGTSTEQGTVTINVGTINDPTDDTITYTPAINFDGLDTFEYTITDSDGDTSTATVSIIVKNINMLPLANVDTKTTDEDISINIDVLANDTFGDGQASPNVISLPSTASEKGGTVSVNNNETINDPADDKITYNPAANFNGIDTFEYTITDIDGDISTAIVTITVNPVNDTPTTITDTTTVEEDSTSNSINILNNDSFGGDGPNSGAITLTSNTTSQGGTVSVNNNGTTNDPTDDTILYSPSLNFNGTDTFDYTITDIDGNTSTATVTITVSSVNDNPTSVNDSVTVDEDSTSIVINVLTNDSFGGDGPNSGAIKLPSATSNQGGTVSVNNNGTANNPTDDTITYNPAANFNGTDSFEYTITDIDGETTTSKVTITVNAVNDTPTATLDTATVDEDSTSNSINVLTNDTFGGDGANAGTIALPNKTSNQGGTIYINDNETPINPEDDTILYTPALDFNGADSFEYTITDADGETSTTQVTITVNPINDSPEAFTDTVFIDEDSSANSIDVLGNDSFGGDGPSSEAIKLPKGSSTQEGTISVNNNGTANDPTDDTITYTPKANFNGVDTFEYSITDVDGDISTTEVSIIVKQTGVKYNPVSAAECFNVFMKNNITVTSGNTGGAMATGNHLTIKGNYNIASQDCGCFNVNDTKLGLLVGHRIYYPTKNSELSIINTNQYAKIGQRLKSTTWYQNPLNENSPIRITPDSDYEATSYIQLQGNAEDLGVSQENNPIFQSNLLDFATAIQTLRSSSRSLAEEANNVELTDTNGEIVANTDFPNEVHINLYNSVNYLNISAEDLNNVTVFNFNQKPNADLVLIINVDAPDTFNWNVWQQTNIEKTESPYILYNFTKTRNLNIIGDKDVFGTILSPFADITKTVNKANISGQVIGQALNHDGGEIQCAIFEGFVFSPKDLKVIPTADFTIEDNNQCLVENEFLFLNTSSTGLNTQPTEPISYSWDFGDGSSSVFMNPTKTYADAGNYDVTLTATNAYGSTIKTIQVQVVTTTNTEVTESNSIINEEAGTVTKEFTLNNNSDYSNFSWSIPHLGSDLFTNEKIVSFEFTEEGEYSLTLNVTNNGCSNTTIIPITITSDEVSTGNDGGLESESLGDAISKRYLQRKMKNEPTIFKKTKDRIYNKKKMQKKLARKSSDLEMLDMFPEELETGDIAHVTSPTDILDYTVAAEVLSVDFSINNKTVGVVLGVKTIDQIYNHTKATCDRLRGAEILNVKTIEIDGYNFLKQALQQRSGVIEHAISFAVGKNDADDFYTLQTNWYVFDYLSSDTVYNFQVWASDPANTTKMVKDILANLNAYKVLEQQEKQKFPRTYATKVSRKLDNLIVNLKSIEEAKPLEISINEKLNETTSEYISRHNPLNTELEQTLTLDINDGYEYDGDVTFDGEIQDAFYHADGNWGLEYDRRYTTVNEYEITNNLDREYSDDELPINRNVQIKAYSEYDYLAVYKSLLPGTISADYSEYKYLSFTARGNGPTQLVLVKSSIENWSEQFRAYVNLTDEEQTFFIPFDTFTSTANSNKIIADDLTTVSFTYVASAAGTNNLDMKISDVKFSKTDASLSVNDEFLTPMKNEFFTYPNPTKGKVSCVIQSDVSAKATATLYDITGKIIYKIPVNLSHGKNEIDFNLKIKAGVMFLKITSSAIDYGTTKLVFK